MFKSIVQSMLNPSNAKRIMFFVIIDAVIIVLSLYMAFLLRFEFHFPGKYTATITIAIPVFITIKLLVFSVFRLYSFTWRFFGINDLWNIITALIVAEAILMALILVPMPSYRRYLTVFDIEGFPRSVFLIDAIVCFLMLAGMRMSKRIYLEVYLKKRYSKMGKRTIIIGAGNTGEMILRDIIRHGFTEFFPVIFLDDDRLKQNTFLHGVKVEGRPEDLKDTVGNHKIEAVIIAIPNLNHKTLKKIYELAREAGITTIKIVPRIYLEHKPNIDIKKLEDIRIEDLIGRQAVDVDYKGIESFLRNKRVLITGAGGSIGSELVMQVFSCEPRSLILLDVDETDLYNVEQRMRTLFPEKIGIGTGETDIAFLVGDIKDKELIDRVFMAYQPEVVFHAAAYKHVPIIEFNAPEAVKVNIFGTHNLAHAAVRYNVSKFIMISTDKAVRPTSVMGGTKRLAEYVCRAFNQKSGTEFVSVRFGNVLGSRGSVLPIFMEQLRRGGPLTVTHKDMQRYFMTIPEAVSLVLQASVLGNGGEVMVLDMGEPVKIMDLAKELVKIHGFELDKDIDIVFTGMRPGEKLFEELLTAEEGTTATRHQKIFVARESASYTVDAISQILKEFDLVLQSSYADGNQKVKNTLKKYIKYYLA